MPLTIDLKQGDKLIINGAVIESGSSNSKLVIHNKAAILRGREILSEQEANTPATRVYFALQCAYMFPDKKEDYLKLFHNYLNEFVAASPSSAELVEKVQGKIAKENYYSALRDLHDLIEHETKVMEAAGIKLNP